MNLTDTFTTLHTFQDNTVDPNQNTDGATPFAGLIQASNGVFYGTTSAGGVNGKGTVYRITTAGVYAKLHDFDGEDGNDPEAELVEASDGNLYGTTVQGGDFDAGTVFRITPGGNLTTLYSFTGDVDGAGPHAPLIQAQDGNLYGTTRFLGGPNGSGTIFSITQDGALTPLHTFAGGSEGIEPNGLVQAPDGSFYGTTRSGGANNGDGTIFRFGPASTVAPALTSATSVSGVVGQPFNYQLTATNLPTAFVLYFANLFSPGLTFDPATGLVSGTPTGAGTFSPSFGASNARGTSPQLRVSFTFNDLPPLPTAPGSTAATFDPGTGANSEVRAAAYYPDGRYILGGSFTTYYGQTRSGIVRVNADGTLDTSFDPGSGADGPVNALLLQADGRIVLGGDFTSVNGVARNGLARLNADGSVDAMFDAQLTGSANGTTSAYYPSMGVSRSEAASGKRLKAARGPITNASGKSGFVTSLSTDAAGNLIVGGSFVGTVLGGVQAAILRIKGDTGQIDPVFSSPATPNGRVRATLALPGGKSVIGGEFTTVGGKAHPGIAQLNADGSVDDGFDPGGQGAQGGAVNALALQADGSIVLGGEFTNVAGTARIRVARIKADGSLDASFDPGTGANAAVTSVSIQVDTGKILLGGQFTRLNDLVTAALGRLYASGKADATFNAGSGANGTVSALAQGTGKSLLIGGDFTSVASMDANRLALLGAGEVSFFTGQIALDGGVYYQTFAGGGGFPFGYYSFLSAPGIIFHFDLGFEYFIDAGDSLAGVYFYDFKSNGFFYTSAAFPFPYLYDFSLNSTVYYYPDPSDPNHYNTNGVRYFYRFDTGTIFSK